MGTRSQPSHLWSVNSLLQEIPD
uniref:Uncharacterized protein n=1 Tax=Rhizophora mucronata TaxID=61149 RepID=A0A2P2R574_RHIMU